MIYKDSVYETGEGERGAALVSVLFISLLLGTACVALLSAVSAGSKNNTDALTEYKAYYAAESGLQATINVLRNTVEGDSSPVTYSEAVNDGFGPRNDDLSKWIGEGPIAVGSEASYNISVTDPDNSVGSIIYTTVGSFEQTNGTYAPTRCYPNCSASNRLTFSFNNQASTTANHPVTDGQALGSLQVVKTGTGTAPSMGSTPLKFRIDFVMSEPRPATRTIRGWITNTGAISFGAYPSTSRTYKLMGSTITLCDSATGCTTPSKSLLVSSNDPFTDTEPIFATMEQIQPYRLKVKSTGYGPNGATKQLEAIVQRNFFNDLDSPAAITMVGPNAAFIAPFADVRGGATVPSVTVSDTQGLNNVQNGAASLSPAPEITANDVPDWQSSPAALDALVKQLRQAAKNSGRYYPVGQNPSTYGDHTTGKGITFVEGDCVSFNWNEEGGGILVVTGSFITFGGFNFNGLIMVLGDEGVQLNLGWGTVDGNLLIAPYDPNNLAAGWGRPTYLATTDTNNYPIVNSAFNGTSAVTDFMLGVAEK